MGELKAAAKEMVWKWDNGEADTEFGRMKEPPRVTLARAYLAEHDETAVDEAWIRSAGFSATGDGFLQRWTKLIPPINPEAAIAELSISPEDGGWSVSLGQGFPDDPNAIDDIVLLSGIPDALTRGHVRRLCTALGIPLKEPANSSDRNTSG